MRQPADSVQISLFMKGPAPLTWVFAGDSITQGVKHTHGRRSFVELCAEYIRWEKGRRMDMVINSGVDGSTTTEMLANFSWLIGRFDPHIVLLMMGTNDCNGGRVPLGQFEEHLRTFLNRVRAGKGIPVLQTPSYIMVNEAGSGTSGSRESIGQYAMAIRLVAEETGTILVDHWKHWEQAAVTDPGMLQSAWLDDPIHPGPKGHVEIAGLIVKQLRL